MHQAQPKEGHKIWLTHEADAKSWSSLKHVQPKEGRKELAPREIKFRYRRLDTTIRERAISRYFIRFLEKDSSRKLIFFLIFGRRFLEKDDFQQDPLLFETRPTPSCKKMADGQVKSSSYSPHKYKIAPL